MSSTQFIPVISQELQAIVRNNKNIKTVYFDADNRHYFNVWKLREDSKDNRPESQWDYFGTGLFSHQQEIPGLFNVDKKKESISKGDPSARIVAKMERSEILTSQTFGYGHILQKMEAEDTPSVDIEELKKQILSPALLSLLEGIESGTLKVVAVQPEQVQDTNTNHDDSNVA
jgi:hypothetical protein